MGFSENMRQARLVFYEQDVEEINKILSDFLARSQAKCALLIDKDGHPVTKQGQTESFNADSIAALVAGSFAATRAIAQLVGEAEFSVLFHQGKRTHIQIASIADRALAVIIFDDSTTLGMIRLYAGELNQKLSACLNQALLRNQSQQRGVGAEFGKAADEVLDNFFDAPEKT